MDALAKGLDVRPGGIAASADGRPVIAVVCGPTATGKSAVALHLAQRFGGEVISADSMQIYRGLTIGTAAVTEAEASGVPHHLVGFLPPDRAFSLADWLQAARALIEEITAKGALPVLCGGTGLYIENLVNGISFTEDAGDAELRARLYAEWEEQGGQALYERLTQLDPERAGALHPNDQKRVLRALELRLATGRCAAERDAASKPAQPPYRALLLGLDYPRRQQLYEAIENRVDSMIAAGLLEEARVVWQNREAYQTAAQAIGYKEFFPYFAGQAPLAECVAKLKQATRNYAKRQRTWFARMEGIHWLMADDEERQAKAGALTGGFLTEFTP